MNKVSKPDTIRDAMAMETHLEFLQQELQDTREELFALVEICTLINSVLDVSKLIDIIMEMAKKVLNAEASSLMLLDEKTGELTFKVAHGEVGEKIKEIRIPPGKGIAGWVAKSGKSLLIPDVTKDSRFYSTADETTHFRTRSIICAPLISREKIIGIVEVLNKMPGKGTTTFTENDLRLLEALANQSAVALENAVLYERLSSEKKKIETIVNSMRDAVVVTDTDFRIAMANPAAEALFPGVSTATGENRNLKLQIILEELMQNPRDGYFDVVLMKPENAVLSNSVTLMRNEAEAGAIHGAILAMRNISQTRERQRAVNEFIAMSSNLLKDRVDSLPRQITDKLEDHTLKLIYYYELEGGPIRLDRSSGTLGDLVSKTLEELQLNQSQNPEENPLGWQLPSWSQPDLEPELNLDMERIGHIIQRLVRSLRSQDPNQVPALKIEITDSGAALEFSCVIKGEWANCPDTHFRKWEFQDLLHSEPLAGSPLETAYFMHVLDAHGGEFRYDRDAGTARLFIPVLKEIGG